MVSTGLPMFGEARTVKLSDDVEEFPLHEEGKRKLEALNKALSESKLQTKVYTPRGEILTYGAGAGSDIEFEAMLSYWLSWYILPDGPEESLNAYIYPLAIRLARGDRLTLAPIYLGSLFYRTSVCRT